MLLRNDRRVGLTLVELLVVITIIAFMAALTALYFPRYQDRELVSRGADQLQGWLLSARQQARRDGVPTGLRLFVDGPTTGFNNGVNKYVRRLAYIQQPEDSAQGLYFGKTDQVGTTTKAIAYFSLPSGVTLGTTALPVEGGDYLELYGGGVVHRIDQIRTDKKSMDLAINTATLPGTTRTSGYTAPDYTTNEPTNYRIIRQPAPIPGEQELILPPGGALDLGASVNVCIDFASGKTANCQTRTVGGQEICDILFAPSGALIGQDTTNAQVILWVRDGMRINSSDTLAGHATLITIQPRTGFIAAHPAAPGSDPYQFTKDARSSGM